MSDLEQDLPPLFDKKGIWVGYDAATLEQLPPERVALYRDLEAVALRLADKESAVKTLQDETAEHAAHRVACLAAMPKPMTQHELWKQTFGRRL